MNVAWKVDLINPKTHTITHSLAHSEQAKCFVYKHVNFEGTILLWPILIRSAL